LYSLYFSFMYLQIYTFSFYLSSQSTKSDEFALTERESGERILKIYFYICGVLNLVLLLLCDNLNSLQNKKRKLR
jgi:hypothetical protein